MIYLTEPLFRCPSIAGDYAKTGEYKEHLVWRFASFF